MPTTLMMLPPQTPTTRAWAARLAAAVPDLSVVVAETEPDGARAVGDADAAFGTMPDALLREARRLRWLQAPQAAPPAGYYTPALIAHPVVVTNFREIYNDHIGAHIMAFVLAFARGLHYCIPRQLRREWRSATWWTRRPGSSRAHSRPLRLPDQVQHRGHTVAAI
jgi:phosphoglycerate dehydrogenase-like enzyme